MNRAEPSTGGGRVERSGVHEVAPEDECASVATVWAGRKQVGRLDDRCAAANRVPSDAELPFDVARIDAGSAARHTRYDRGRAQVEQHVPRVAQHDGLVTAHAVGAGDSNGGVDRAHVAILGPRSGIRVLSFATDVAFSIDQRA